MDTKVKAITDFPKPETVEQMRRFLGMINFYRAHLPNAAESQSILNQYLHNSKRKDKTPIHWTESADKAFEQCKDSLKNAVLLSHPLPDAPLALFTDSSDSCVGGVLNQREGKSWKPLGYFSKKLSDTQKKYSTYDRELLGIYMSVCHFRNMIEGRQLTIHTDHKPLTYVFSKMGSDKETPRRTRQLMFISEFTTDIQHVKGNDNVVADSLSRVEEISCPTAFAYDELADAQKHDDYIASKKYEDDKVRIQQLFLPSCNNHIYCETSTKNARPYLTEHFRRIAFDAIHNLSHPGIRTTRKMVSSKFFWPNMNKDIGFWAKTCIQCQRAKVNRHTFAEFQQFPVADRFRHIHVDIIGPLPTSPEGFKYCITIIDRCTHWPEAFPVQDITAETTAKIIYEGWIARYGCPVKLTSDQGRQFESNLFAQLMKFLGIHKLRTTPYHPQSNGKVERWHRSLKSALSARLNGKSWVAELPTVLFGLRAALRSDCSVSAAEMTFGQAIRLPSDFYDVSSREECDAHTLVEQVRNAIDSYKPSKSIKGNSRPFFVHPDLQTCSHVFIRDDTVRRPLKPPYDGPYRVVSRKSKDYLVQLPSRQVSISVDRLKPAYLLNDTDESTTGESEDNRVPENIFKDNNVSNPTPFRTRSGRAVKQPTRFAL